MQNYKFTLAYYATLNDDTTVYLLSQDKIAPLLALL